MNGMSENEWEWIRLERIKRDRVKWIGMEWARVEWIPIQALDWNPTVESEIGWSAVNEQVTSTREESRLEWIMDSNGMKRNETEWNGMG